MSQPVLLVYNVLMARYFKRIWLAARTGAPYGVGAFIPDNVLLVGEQASDPTHAPHQQPFCSTKGCSGWLNKLLEAEKIPEEKLFWLNALDNVGATINVAIICEIMTPRLVIALGAVASKTCTAQGIEHVSCPHPQYWKRFKSKHRYPLLDLLHEQLNDINQENRLE